VTNMSEDNKVKLLKIQHALLEALSEKKIHAETEEIRNRIANELNISLLKYKELVTEIEHGIYLELKDRLSQLVKVDRTLEEELEQLEEIENFYNQLIEIQTRFKQTYALYSTETLILSDINKLKIELYLKRKEAIKAYLINKKNINDNKKKIEKINDELISEEQKETRIDKKIAFLDEEIIRRLLSAEGRLLVKENNQEKLQYTSITNEYQNIGINLEKDGYTGKNLTELNSIAEETKEKLMAATISYEVLPNIEKKTILDEISLENVTANYQLVMGKLLVEFYTPSKNCVEALQKRERIKDLLKYRQTYITKLGIKYAADPFARLHINEQYEELKQYENNSRIIARLRRELAELNARIETLTTDNIQNLALLEGSQRAIENGEMSVTVETNEPTFNDFITDINPAEVRILDNQVVSVTDVKPNFNYKKTQEITERVLNKVYEILMHPEISIPTEKTPELIIEQSNSNVQSEIKQKTNIQPEKIEEPILPMDIFIEPEISVEKNNSLPEIFPEVTPEVDWNPELIIEPKITVSSNEMEPITVEEVLQENGTNSILNEQNPVTPEVEPESNFEPEEPIIEFPTNNVVNENESQSELIMPQLFDNSSEEQVTSNIFNDITPFETPTMFTEKVDSLEPEKIYPSINIPVNNVQEKSEEFDEMTIKLEENRVADNIVDFWSTDADINNIAIQPQSEETTIHRKGI